ncbi:MULTISPECIES: hypothetical protein [unclassified Acinetobacter]|uniref:hypothetical protein n=1 Tax=unclassified Acinetobacter TaxID=196816 RepID=UPI0015D1EDC4|nr:MULTISPECIES: hypothetical protein [unclassified Acinetobacter]
MNIQEIADLVQLSHDIVKIFSIESIFITCCNPMRCQDLPWISPVIIQAECYSFTLVDKVQWNLSYSSRLAHSQTTSTFMRWPRLLQNR